MGPLGHWNGSPLDHGLGLHPKTSGYRWDYASHTFITTGEQPWSLAKYDVELAKLDKLHEEKEQERFAKLEIEKAEEERLAAETTERETTGKSGKDGRRLAALGPSSLVVPI